MADKHTYRCFREGGSPEQVEEKLNFWAAKGWRLHTVDWSAPVLGAMITLEGTAGLSEDLGPPEAK